MEGDTEEARELVQKPEESSNLEPLWVWANKVVGFLAGLTLFAIGGLQWYEYDSISTTNFQLYIIAGYVIFFGVVVMVCEFFACGGIRYFAFLYTWFGRGLFYLFAGSQCVGLARSTFPPLAIVLGLSIMSYGVFLMIVAFPLRKWGGPKPILSCGYTELS